MRSRHDHETELLRRLLARTDHEPSQEHVDLELLALFAQNALPEVERQRVVEHLADCTDCRRAASELIKLEHEAVALSAEPVATVSLAAPQQSPWRAGRLMLLALAACLLVAVTLVLYPRGPGDRFAENKVYEETKQLLASKQFSEAHQKIGKAEKHGTHSDRLSSLDAQADREMTATLALNQAGRLTDFGVDVSGAIRREVAPSSLTKGLTAAEQSLAKISGKDLDALLNRGHVALSDGRYSDALADFDAAAALAPEEPLPWLGLGLAHFLSDDLTAAEHDFRQAAELAPRAVAPRFNLAITLEEQGRKTDALAEWQSLLTLQLSKEERTEIERAIELLKNQKP